MNFIIAIFLIFSVNFHGVSNAQKMTEVEPYAGGVVYAPDGVGPHVVCVDEAEVRGGPDETRVVHYTLTRGTEVNVRERAKWTGEGWAMIQPAYWVKATDLCEIDG